MTPAQQPAMPRQNDLLLDLALGMHQLTAQVALVPAAATPYLPCAFWPCAPVLYTDNPAQVIHCLSGCLGWPQGAEGRPPVRSIITQMPRDVAPQVLIMLSSTLTHTLQCAHAGPVICPCIEGQLEPLPSTPA